MKQNTLSSPISFEGKGLHTGTYAHMTVKPAPENYGVRFLRTDIGPEAFVYAFGEKVSSTARSTTISEGEVSVSTIEHIMSALTGMGIDNALIEIDNVEVPILDGSASLYIKAIQEVGITPQEADRKYIDIAGEIEIHDEKSGSWVKITPDTKPSFDITVDFGSKVLGVQNVKWDESIDYSKEIGICRTFVFFHEIEFLFANNLIKGGDVNNAIVVVEHPVAPEQLSRMKQQLGLDIDLKVEEGYLNTLKLHFPDETGRHKLLDMIGDLRLAGGWLNARVTGFKTGHGINTKAAAAVRKQIK